MQTQEEINNDALISEGGIPVIQKDDRVKKAGTDTIQEPIVQGTPVIPPVTPVENVENVEKIETKTIQQPTVQETTTESSKITDTTQKAIKPITTIEEFKTAGATTKELTSLLENRAVENIEIQGNKVTGEKNGERFEWTIDQEKNPIRKSLGLIGGEKENFAKNADIAFSINSQGQTVFNPQNTDEVIDLYTQFGDKVNIKKGSVEAIRGTAIWQKFSKYRGASQDVYFNGLKNGEIAEGGATWDRVLRMNNGVMTPQMEQAKEKYEVYLETNKINKNSAELYKAFGGDSEVTVQSSEQNFRDAVEKLDSKYISTFVDIIENIENMYSTFKEGKEETNDLRKKANETASKMDEIEVAKRKILKDIQENNPKLPLSSQLQLASNRTEDLNDELFALQRQYNIEISDYQYADTQDKSEFEFNMKMAEYKAGFIDSIYEVQRGELIRQEDIARSEKEAKNEREYLEQQLQASYEIADEVAAKQYEREIAMIEKQQGYNDKFKAFSVSGGILKFNPLTGDVEMISAEEAVKNAPERTEPTKETISQWSNWNGYPVTQTFGTPSVNSKDDVVLNPKTGKKGTPGIDIAIPQGTLVQSLTGGYIVSTGENGAYGNQIVVRDEQGREHMYSHMSDISFFERGEYVEAGMIIGKSGGAKGTKGAGFSTGPHLDYRIKNKDGKWIDPSPFMVGNMVTTEKTILTGMSIESARQSISEVKKYKVGDIGDGRAVIESRDGTKTIIGSIPGVDISFERTIKNQMPATLLNSEIELLSANEAIKNMFESGINAGEASALYQGFNIESVEDIILGTNILATSRLIKEPSETLLASISQNINAGEKGKAIKRLESEVESEYPDTVKNRTATRQDIEELNYIKGLIKEGGKGVVEGSIENLKGKLGDTKYITLKSALGQYSTEKINEIFGTDFTGSEGSSAEDIILSGNENVSALFGKIDVFKGKLLRDYNIARDEIGLPTLTEEQFLDPELRIPLYSLGKSEIQQKPTDAQKEEIRRILEGKGEGEGEGEGDSNFIIKINK